MIQRGDAVVIEARCLGAVHRHFFRTLAPQFTIALILFGDIAQCIERALAVEFIDRHEIGEVEHVDFFELRGSAEFRRHHIHAEIDVRDDGGIALADAGSLDDDQIEAGGLAGGNDIRQRL